MLSENVVSAENLCPWLLLILTPSGSRLNLAASPMVTLCQTNLTLWQVQFQVSLHVTTVNSYYGN